MYGMKMIVAKDVNTMEPIVFIIDTRFKNTCIRQKNKANGADWALMDFDGKDVTSSLRLTLKCELGIDVNTLFDEIVEQATIYGESK